tara:strand:- start:12916 stop:13749 length:834 start_codon:yes stop_codon:yes gene_type:complete
MVKIVASLMVVLAVGIFAIQIFHRKGTSESGTRLMVFCAAGIQKPAVAIAHQYLEEYGVEVQLQFGGTGTLLSQVQISNQGDLFIAADDSAVQSARDSGAVVEVIPLARQYPVMAVASGNPKGVATLHDLLREDIRVAVGNPEATSIGKATKRGLGDEWAALAGKVAVMKPTVTEIAADLKVGAVDVAVIWNSTIPQFKGLEAIRIPEFDAETDNVSVTVLTASKQPAEALKFARYLAAPEKGQSVFKAMGFETISNAKGRLTHRPNETEGDVALSN